MEKEYLENLKWFLKNEGGTEKEFLIKEINRFDKAIEEIEKDNPEWREKDGLIDLLKAVRLAESITKFKDMIFDYTTRLSRIPNDKKEIPEIDFSDSKGTEIIIMLEKLGIIQYLKEKEPFNTSTNSLARVISGFTGMGVSTVQSYINPINNPDVDQKNNPLLSKKTVDKVNQKFIPIGFKPSK